MCGQDPQKYIDEETLNAHAKKHSLQKGAADLQDVHLCGAKAGTSNCGIDFSAIGNLRLQVSLLSDLG